MTVRWHQVFLGHMVSNWSCLQQDSLASLLWLLIVLGVSTIIWDCVHHTWIAHNETLHGLDATTHEKDLVDHFCHETGDLYTRCHDVIPCSQNLLYSDVSEHFIQVYLSQSPPLALHLETCDSRKCLPKPEDGNKSSAVYLQLLHVIRVHVVRSSTAKI